MKKKKISPNGWSLKMLRTYYPLRGGWGFYNVLFEMDARGYDVVWHLFNSKDYGVPQNRERVYIVGHSRARGRRKIFFKTGTSSEVINQVGNIVNTSSFGGNPQRGRVYGTDGIAPTINTCQGGGLEPKVIINPAKIQTIVNGMQGGRIRSTKGLAATLLSDQGGPGGPSGLYGDPEECTKFIDLTVGAPTLTDNARCITAQYAAGVGNRRAERSGVIKIRNGTKKGYLLAKPGDGVDLSYPESTQQRGRVQPARAHTLTTDDSKAVVTPPGINITRKKPGGHQREVVYGDDGICGALCAADCKAPKFIESRPIEDIPRIRKLTPRECWRLQGFTDEQFDKAAAVNSNTQLYKQAGNAVTVNVVEVVGRAIIESEPDPELDALADILGV